MSSDPPAPDPAAGPPGPPAAAPAFTPEELKLALKAFNKRLRLTRLDDESKLGHGAMTAGGKSGIVAISPPNQYPKAMWDELVRQGKLKYVGHGLYEPVQR
jgi:hypothetical protein